ncbi:MAG: hypothetical protein HC812_15620 [Leptolyngbya sp. RL_3_1]|nr:hypothetical protein [Leptolyngbya sp. RL_3_1]
MLNFQLLQTLGARGVDRLGDWNPQLLRELKGRLKRFPVLAAIGLSLIVQGMLMLSLASMLPGRVMAEDLFVDTYPQIQWNGVAPVDPALQSEVTLPDGQTLQLTANIVVAGREQPLSISGDRDLGQQALGQIQRGDRLIAINGEPVILKTEDERHWSSGYVNQQITSHLSPVIVNSAQAFAESQETVELTLSRPGLGLFTVPLPRITRAQQYNRYCRQGDQGCDITPDRQFYRVDWPNGTAMPFGQSPWRWCFR